MQKFQSHIAFVLLVLFGFPYIQKEIHDFEHQGDSHCYVVGEKHFHKMMHVCFICDFLFGDSKMSLKNSLKKIPPAVCGVVYIIFNGSLIHSNLDYKFSPRGPPVIPVLSQFKDFSSFNWLRTAYAEGHDPYTHVPLV